MTIQAKLFFYKISHRMVKARIQEALRMAKAYNGDTYVYIRYVYIDTRNFLSDVS